MRTHFKKTIFVLALLASAIVGRAQFSIRGGIGGGVITGPVKIENIGNRFTDVINGDNVTGFEAGFLLKARVGPVYIKPMAMYSFRTGNVSYTNGADGTQQNTDFTMHKLEVPVMLGVHFLGPFYVEAGPSYNYIFSVTEKYNDYSVQVTPSAIGYRVGLGAELGPVVVSVNYGGATYSYSGDRATFREPYKLIFGLGIMFGGDLPDKESRKSFDDR